ncbi:MAG: hypothetical protein OEN20_04765 [Gammaproteobacteria bacterium]|nr:hypothetical protein [Gammaproteobacteria bacterium]
MHNPMATAWQQYTPQRRWNSVGPVTAGPRKLLVAAVADCFILSFRAIARASKLSMGCLAL